MYLLVNQISATSLVSIDTMSSLFGSATKTAQKEAQIIRQLESGLAKLDFRVQDLNSWFIGAGNQESKNKILQDAEILGCEPWGLFSGMAAFTAQSFRKSTMVYPNKDVGTGERTGIHYGFLGPSGIGKTKLALFMLDVAETFKNIALDWLVKTGLLFNVDALEILFTASRMKAILEQVIAREGLGLLFFIEGSLVMFRFVFRLFFRVMVIMFRVW